MDNWILRQTVDLKKPYEPYSGSHVLMAPGDALAHTWRISVKNGGEDADLTNAEATGYFARSDGNVVPVAGYIDGSTVGITLDEACYAYSGPLRGMVRLRLGAVMITIATALFTVVAEIGDTYVDPGNVFPSLRALSAIVAGIEQKHAADIAEVKTDISDAEREIAVNAARIDQIIADGTPADETELPDVRIDYHGATYSTAGAAVRAQAYEMDKRLKNVNYLWGGQLFDPGNVTVGKYLAYDSGREFDNADFCYYRGPVLGGKRIYITPAYVQIVFFDASGAYISGTRFTIDESWYKPFHVIDAPDNAVEVAVSVRYAYRNAMKCSFDVQDVLDRVWTLEDAEYQRFMPNDGSMNGDGSYALSTGSDIMRRVASGTMFERMTYCFRVDIAGEFAFGTRPVESTSAGGIYCLVSAANRTFKIYASNWADAEEIKRNLTIDFDILAGETYIAEIVKNSLYECTIRMYCVEKPEKTFEYIHTDVMNNKFRIWGGIAMRAVSGTYTVFEMCQAAASEDVCSLVMLGDSFVECSQSTISSSESAAYLLREELGTRFYASGMGGDTTTALLRRTPADLAAVLPKYVFLQVGSNDSVSISNLETYKSNMLELIGYIEQMGAVPILTTIPRRYDEDNTAFITEANAWIKALGYKYIDEEKLLAGHLLDDGIHPDENGHRIIYNAIKYTVPDAW